VTEPAVRLRDVVVAYDGHIALRVDHLDVPRGAITAVIGPNGAGKSTLLGAITGLVRPRRGTIRVLGDGQRARRNAIAYVLQDSVPNEVVPITVREVVTMGRYATSGIVRPLRRADRDAVDRAMARVDVADLARRHLRELSAGQRQRVYVAQGLAQDGDLLLLDEPAAGLDIPTHERIT
jgi:iron complex transport system ATP-binding protein